MANTIPATLINDVFATFEVTSRERCGFIGSVGRDSSLDTVAQNSTIRSPTAPAATASDITPGLYAPDAGDQTFTARSFNITKQRSVPFRWNGVQTYDMNMAGTGKLTLQQQQIAQAIRTLRNEIEIDLGALAVNASRGYGTASTDPFASTLADAANARKILLDNGAPESDLQMVINSGAELAMLGLTQLTKVNESGGSQTLRMGELGDIFGLRTSVSAQVYRPTSGTLASAATTNAGYAVGATVITLQTSTGTGIAVAGDVITFAGDANKYVVASVSQAGANPGTGDTITLQAPGLRKAIAASNVAITVVAISARNLVFERSALVLGTRLPDLPEDGDAATAREVITDPYTGLSFELAKYPQYRQNAYHLGIAWGTGCFRPEFVATILGA